MNGTVLVVMARAPEHGRVKTRLAAAIGEDRALAVYRRLLDRTAALARRWTGPVAVHFSGSHAAIRASPLGVFPCWPQSDGNLGNRLRSALSHAMSHAMSHAIDRHGRAIAVGTDCPALTIDDLAILDRHLERHPVSVGPAEDGGYWGIGVRGAEPLAICCDETLPWSTPDLLRETTARLSSSGRTWGLGPRRADLDDASDLARAHAVGALARPDAGRVRISIVVPILDEAAALPRLLDRLGGIDGPIEILIADGGSRDGSVAIARGHPLVDAVLCATGGRHRQLDAALATARGDYVLLLPADARLPQRAVPLLLAALKEQRPIAGCLRRFASNRGRVHRWLDGWARIRAAWSAGAYMDQAPFIHRRSALAAGGFPAVGPYDTASFGRRLSRRGAFTVLPVPLVISCRSYARSGFAAVTLRHQAIRLRHHLRGASR